MRLSMKGFALNLKIKAPHGLLMGTGLELKHLDLTVGVETSRDVKSEVRSAACRDIYKQLIYKR